MNIAATFRPGRVSRSTSANLPTSTERSRICSPGMRIRGSVRASPPLRNAQTVQAGPPPDTSTPQIKGSSLRLCPSPLGIPNALPINELQLVGRRGQPANANSNKVTIDAVSVNPLVDQCLVR